MTNPDRRKTARTNWNKWEYYLNGKWLIFEELTDPEISGIECVVTKKILQTRLSDMFAKRQTKFKTIEQCMTTPYMPRKVLNRGTEEEFNEFVGVLKLFRPIQSMSVQE